MWSCRLVTSSVDDTLTALPRDHIKQFHQHVNSIEASIQFTVEEESDGSIPFLDTRITRHDDGSLSTTVFRKQTHTDRYLDFSSHHPLAHKTAVVRTLLARADRICTFVTDKDAEKEHVTKALSSNGYPKAVVDRNRPPATLSTLSPPCEQETPKAVVTLPYVRHLSESIRRIFTPLGIRTCFCPHQTLRRTLVHLKDRIEPERRAGVVYKIPCRSCTKVYVGQTGRTLEHRLKEHRRALVSGDVMGSAVAQHAVDEGHEIEWSSATVIDGHPNFHRRCALEAWHIRSQDGLMNRDAGPLPQVYNPLIHQNSTR